MSKIYNKNNVQQLLLTPFGNSIDSNFKYRFMDIVKSGDSETHITSLFRDASDIIYSGTKVSTLGTNMVALYTKEAVDGSYDDDENKHPMTLNRSGSIWAIPTHFNEVETSHLPNSNYALGFYVKVSPITMLQQNYNSSNPCYGDYSYTTNPENIKLIRPNTKYSNYYTATSRYGIHPMDYRGDFRNGELGYKLNLGVNILCYAPASFDSRIENDDYLAIGIKGLYPSDGTNCVSGCVGLYKIKTDLHAKKIKTNYYYLTIDDLTLGKDNLFSGPFYTFSETNGGGFLSCSQPFIANIQFVYSAKIDNNTSATETYYNITSANGISIIQSECVLRPYTTWKSEVNPYIIRNTSAVTKTFTLPSGSTTDYYTATLGTIDIPPTYYVKLLKIKMTVNCTGTASTNEDPAELLLKNRDNTWVTIAEAYKPANLSNGTSGTITFNTDIYGRLQYYPSITLGIKTPKWWLRGGNTYTCTIPVGGMVSYC